MKTLRNILAGFLPIALLALSSCDKCYDCTLKCGTCTNGTVTVAGCQGDSILQGQSVDAWKAYFESQGYSCAYNNTTQEACGKENKDELSDLHYECLTN
ncbi:MAG: hypothetical protein KBF73_09585 [Flavobacteriales bacterium]|nr:hypothetical protein [Flavobacteriales bacterium]